MIVFVDFDGVLHAEDTIDKANLLSRLPLVEEVLREFPRAEIVVSSAWRLNWPHPTLATLELRRHFSEDIAPRVVGVTPNFIHLDRQNAPDGLYLYRRQWECEMWMRAHCPAWPGSRTNCPKEIRKKRSWCRTTSPTRIPAISATPTIR